jgi:hypothetical protein
MEDFPWQLLGIRVVAQIAPLLVAVVVAWLRRGTIRMGGKK